MDNDDRYSWKFVFESEEKTFNFRGFNRYVSIEFSWWV